MGREGQEVEVRTQVRRLLQWSVPEMIVSRMSDGDRNGEKWIQPPYF